MTTLVWKLDRHRDGRARPIKTARHIPRFIPESPRATGLQVNNAGALGGE